MKNSTTSVPFVAAIAMATMKLARPMSILASE
jgi:hypothetical protein